MINHRLRERKLWIQNHCKSNKKPLYDHCSRESHVQFPNNGSCSTQVLKNNMALLFPFHSKAYTLSEFVLVQVKSLVRDIWSQTLLKFIFPMQVSLVNKFYKKSKKLKKVRLWVTLTSLLTWTYFDWQNFLNRFFFPTFIFTFTSFLFCQQTSFSFTFFFFFFWTETLL